MTKTKEATDLKVPWACPRCGAPHSSHGKGGKDKCLDRLADASGCQGFICDCDDPGDDEDHGSNFQDPCTNAVCYHCGWNGVFPKLPKKLEAWEKKALAAGWSPPSSRKKDLGL